MAAEGSALKTYYRHLFPADQLVNWLSYGDKPSFARREVSMTLPGDVYIRFKSFATGDALRNELVAKGPDKMDIGAFYNVNPMHKDRERLAGGLGFHPVAREVVFDIDASDYDDVRTCCDDKRICNDCWPIIGCAVPVLTQLLKEAFGYEDLLWVFSGRRGIHCWVCDKAARALDDDQRAALGSFVSVVESDAGGSRNLSHSLENGVMAPRSVMHPALARAAAQMEKAFHYVFLRSRTASQNSILNSKSNAYARHFLSRLLPDRTPEKGKALDVLGQAKEFDRGIELWEKLRKIFERRKHVLTLLQMSMMWPRLDIAVTRRRDHLLKIPFAAHPATGKVCVILDPEEAIDFDVKGCPTVDHLTFGNQAQIEHAKDVFGTSVRRLERFVTRMQSKEADDEGDGQPGARRRRLAPE